MILIYHLPDVMQGLVISITGYVIVFTALLLLYLSFTLVSKLFRYNLRQKLIKRGKITQDTGKEHFVVPGQVVAAIAMTIYLSEELHDEESNILTIKKASKTYSPWSSKIYGLQDYKK
ncbi:MAG: OadG family protein [Bacteroidales bacterium]|nr:OadG family protein [Bacteroidales bacterium]